MARPLDKSILDDRRRRHLVCLGGCLPLTVLTTIAFIVLSTASSSIWANQDFWGKLKSGTGTCEPQQLASAVREPVNSWTNLAYTLLGSWSIGTGLMDAVSLRSKVQASPRADMGDLRSNPEFSIGIGLAFALLGVSSFLWHASFLRLFQQWDVGAMTGGAASLVCWSLCSLLLWHSPFCRRRPRLTRYTLLLLIPVAEVLLIRFKFNYSSATVLTAIISTLIALEVVVQPLFAKRTIKQRLLVAAAVLCIGLAYLIRELEASKRLGKPLCLGSTWFQPHGIWHCGTALAVALTQYMWRLPTPPPPVRRQWWVRVCGIADDGGVASADDGHRVELATPSPPAPVDV